MVQGSPLAGINYPPGAARTWRWVESSVDRLIVDVVQEYVAAGSLARADFRDRLSWDECYTLWRFAIRMSFEALRTGDQAKIQNALYALAMIALERIDWRDFTTPRNLARAVGEKIGAPISSYSERAALLAEPEVAKKLVGPGPRGSFFFMCGFHEIATPEGIGLFADGFNRLAPRAGLPMLAYAIAKRFEADAYLIDTIRVGETLPSVWLEAETNRHLRRALKRVRGCVRIEGELAERAGLDGPAQQIRVYLAEAASAKEAQTVIDAAPVVDANRPACIAAGNDELCVLIWQHPDRRGIRPHEDTQTLTRFRADMVELMGAHKQEKPIRSR